MSEASNLIQEFFTSPANANWLTAFGTVALVGATLALLLGVRWQLRENSLAVDRQLDATRRTHTVALVLSQRERYESVQMRAARRRTATALLGEKPTLNPSEDEVLVFFETLGFSVKHQSIDKLTVWNHFAWEARLYSEALNRNGNQIEMLRTVWGDPQLYDNFLWLTRECELLDEKQETPPRDIEAKDVESFLKDECNLA